MCSTRRVKKKRNQGKKKGTSKTPSPLSERETSWKVVTIGERRGRQVGRSVDGRAALGCRKRLLRRDDS